MAASLERLEDLEARAVAVSSHREEAAYPFLEEVAYLEVQEAVSFHQEEVACPFLGVVAFPCLVGEVAYLLAAVAFLILEERVVSYLQAGEE